MKKIIAVCISLFILFRNDTAAQYSKYIIRFTDKVGTPFTIDNPSQFLSQRSILRRSQQKISIDVTDLPVSPAYVDSINLAGDVKILNTSKWLNHVCIETTDTAALSKINAFAFVQGSTPVMKAIPNPIINKKFDDTAVSTSPLINGPLGVTAFDYGATFPQIHTHQGEFLHDHGLDGKGMMIAVMDAGFFRYTSLSAFDSLRQNKQVVETFDFVKNENGVAEDNSHGMHCLSILAGNLPGQFVGSCPKANYILYRTEDVPSETLVEEQNWIAAAERADSIGADVFSTSLGYTTFDNAAFNHTYQDLDGNTTMIAKASDLAAKKGILSVVAAGNSGNNSWHYISTPADADSALSVGSVTEDGQSSAFSSYGPSSDGQVKPSVASVGSGTAIINASGNVSNGSGTSYATPNMAGLATCLWQAYKEFTNMDIIEALTESSNNYNIPDDRIGYGIPDMKKAFVILNKRLFQKSVSVSGCKATINYSAKGDTSMHFILERKSVGDSGFSKIYSGVFNQQFSQKKFFFEDDLSNVNDGNVYYRFKQTIGSDTSYHSDSLMLSYANDCIVKKQVVIISPNPATSDLKVAVTLVTAAKVKIEIVNYVGRRIYSSQKDQLAGTLVQSILLMNAATGLYFVTVYINNEKTTVKRILKH
ncbi:MAG: S8 family serine peptidase [Ginsengibacter sp.]